MVLRVPGHPSQRHDAHDAFQATFLVLIRKGRSLWVRESLGPWLHRVACRAAIRARRISKRQMMIEQKVAFLPDGEACEDVDADVAAVIHEEIEACPTTTQRPSCYATCKATPAKQPPACSAAR